jgi:hypothetical protein
LTAKGIMRPLMRHLKANMSFVSQKVQ